MIFLYAWYPYKYEVYKIMLGKTSFLYPKTSDMIIFIITISIRFPRHVHITRAFNASFRIENGSDYQYEFPSDLNSIEIQDRIVKVTPNSVRAREIIAERKLKEEKEKQWKELQSKVMKTYGKS